jgi:hypothetical protein
MRRKGIVYSIKSVWGMIENNIMLPQCILDAMEWEEGDEVTIDSIKMGIDSCITIRNDNKKNKI